MEIEDWNEYGELKQHVKIYYDEFTQPSKPNAGPQAKLLQPVVNQKENVKPAATASEPAKATEQKAPVGGQATSFTLAMRGIGEEAAAKAKEVKKKVEPLVGLGTAEPAKEDKAESPKKDTAESAPVAEADKPESAKKDAGVPPTVETTHKIDSTASIQSPNSTAWKKLEETLPSIDVKAADHKVESVESMQSPTSTSWKPAQGGFPVSTHRGSVVEEASPEEIRRVEEESKIVEEDEEEDDDDSDESDD